MTSNAAQDFSFPQGFWLWLKERFPPAVWLLSIFFYFSSAFFVRGAQGGDLLRVFDIVGLVAAWSFFLFLRVLDEHKDYQEDCMNYPERVLQRGIITLSQLRKVGAACIVLQLVANVIVAPKPAAALVAWGIMMVWTGLMTFEFFVSKWLKSHLILYGISHMLVTPLSIYWMMKMGAPDGDKLPFTSIAMPALSFFAGLLFEVTRKTKGEDEERTAVDSYSKSLGVKVCLQLMKSNVTAMVAITFFLLIGKTSFLPGIVFVIALSLITMWQFGKFPGDPTAKQRKRNEGLVALFIIAVYGTYLTAAWIG